MTAENAFLVANFAHTKRGPAPTLCISVSAHRFARHIPHPSSTHAQPIPRASKVPPASVHGPNVELRLSLLRRTKLFDGAGPRFSVGEKMELDRNEETIVGSVWWEDTYFEGRVGHLVRFLYREES